MSQECPTRVTRVCNKSVLQECPTRVSDKSVPRECQECPSEVATCSTHVMWEAARLGSTNVVRKRLLVPPCPASEVAILAVALELANW